MKEYPYVSIFINKIQGKNPSTISMLLLVLEESENQTVKIMYGKKIYQGLLEQHLGKKTVISFKGRLIYIWTKRYLKD